MGEREFLGIVLSIAGQDVTLRMAAVFLLLSAASTFAAVGLSMRVAVWPSMAKRMLVSMLAWFVILPPLIAWTAKRGDLSAWPFIAIAAALIAAGIWTTYSARRVWLNLEFV